MGLYRWNSGGQYRGKLWEQDLLADSQVCLNLTCLNNFALLLLLLDCSNSFNLYNVGEVSGNYVDRNGVQVNVLHKTLNFTLMFC